MHAKILASLPRLPNSRRKTVQVLFIVSIFLLISYQLSGLYSSRLLDYSLPGQLLSWSAQKGEFCNSNEEDCGIETKQQAEKQLSDSMKNITVLEPPKSHSKTQKISKHDYLSQIFEALVAGKPDFDSVTEGYGGYPATLRGDKNRPVASIKYLSENFLQVTEPEVHNLQEKHAVFMSYVRNKTSELYKAKNTVFKPKSHGIVYVGGGKYSWYSLLSIKHLRRIGSKLPVEVFIPTLDEYEEEFCEKTLPALNAKCVKIYEALDLPILDEHDIKIKGFMFKSLAILLSSFDNLLLLDADNFPYLNPDGLFVSETYLKTKLVLWPDYWQRSTHPAFYEAQGLDIVKLNLNVSDPETGEIKYTSEEQIKNDVFLHDLKGAMPDPSTESGQVMISKSAHFDVVLLSLYYNFYGPNHYYHLLDQGAPGQGDKDTFLAAANYLNSTFYHEETPVRAIGLFQNGNFRGTAQAQHYKVSSSEFQAFQQDVTSIIQQDLCSHQTPPGIISVQDGNPSCNFTAESTESMKKFYGKDDEAKLMFIHGSTPKFDPIGLVYNGDVKNEEGKRYRFYGVLAEPGFYNFEKMQWENIQELLCSTDVEKLVTMSFIRKQMEKYSDVFEMQSFCSEIKSHIEWLDLRLN